MGECGISFPQMGTRHPCAARPLLTASWSERPKKPVNQSLIQSGPLQDASASRKALSRKGRNFRLVYTAKTESGDEDHFGSTRTRLPFAMACSQYVRGNRPIPWPRSTNALFEGTSRLAIRPETWTLTFRFPLLRSQSRSLFLPLKITQSCDFSSAGSAGGVRPFKYSGAATR